MTVIPAEDGRPAIPPVAAGHAGAAADDRRCAACGQVVPEQLPAPLWAARLRAERCRRGWSQRQMAVRLYRAAGETAQARLPRIEHIVRRVVAYESGAHQPSALYAELYGRALGIAPDVIFPRGRGKRPMR